MKKFLIFIVIIAAAGLFIFFKGNSVELNTSSSNPGQSSKPDPNNATYYFDQDSFPVTFSNGRFTNSTGADMRILEEIGYGDLNNDGKEDAAVLIADNSGGTGVFIYVGAYVSGPVNAKGTNTYMIGDRISPQEIVIQNGVLKATYLTRGEDEPFSAEPTIRTVSEYVYKNGRLEER